MGYPDIYPIEPGRDGWKAQFATPVSRLLYHCGLVPTTAAFTPGKRPGALSWAVAKATPLFVRSQETRPLPVTLDIMKKALHRVYRMHGAAEVRDILKVHGLAANPERVKARDYRHVYSACMAALDRRTA